MKFADFLNESEVNGVVLKGTRSSKFNRKGETSLGYVINPEDKKLVAYIWERYDRKYVFVALKTEKIDTAQPTHFVKADKPKIGAFTNYTIDTSDKPDYTFNKKTTVEEILKVFNAKEDRIVISEKADKYLKTTVVESDEEEEDVFIGYDIAHSKKHSELIAGEIDQEVKAIIDDCYGKAKATILEYEDVLHKCADLLLEKEKIGRSEFEALFDQHQPIIDAGEQV